MSFTTYDLLVRFRNKAGAWQSQSQAQFLLAQLKSMLTDSEFWELRLSHQHYQLGEGAAELYDTCSKLEKRYKK